MNKTASQKRKDTITTIGNIIDNFNDISTNGNQYYDGKLKVLKYKKPTPQCYIVLDYKSSELNGAVYTTTFNISHIITFMNNGENIDYITEEGRGNSKWLKEMFDITGQFSRICLKSLMSSLYYYIRSNIEDWQNYIN